MNHILFILLNLENIHIYRHYLYRKFLFIGLLVNVIYKKTKEQELMKKKTTNI